MNIQPRRACVADQLPPDWHPVLRRVLCNRGISTQAQASLAMSGLLSYTQLKGMDAAVALLLAAREQQARVLVVGDFDADGATGTAVAVAGLRALGFEQVAYLVPDRFVYGYGLSPEIVELALQAQPQLLITVDNGISSLAGVAAARAAGVPVLITDHHLPGRDPPDANAIVNPNQPGCSFPSKALAGVGVMFYVLAGLRAALRSRGAEDLPSLAPLLDLVALGTVADLVPLDQNNRILAEQGLKRMRAGQLRPGIKALFQVAKRDVTRAVATDLAFSIAPRLNAAGRLEDMRIGIECLLAEEVGRALDLAQQLDELNCERRELQEQTESQANAIVSQLPKLEEQAALSLYQSDWHQGIVGLVASKVKERRYRPVFAFAPADDTGTVLKGSGRSIPGYHLRDALDRIATRNPGLIAKFGGHAMAAGMSLAADQLPQFRQAFAADAKAELSADQLTNTLHTDGELQAGDLAMPLAQALRNLGPWGQAFPEPVFEGRFILREQRIVGAAHLRMRVSSTAGGEWLTAIAFRETREFPIGAELGLIYRLDVNEYRGAQSVQLVVERIVPDGASSPSP